MHMATTFEDGGKVYEVRAIPTLNIWKVRISSTASRQLASLILSTPKSFCAMPVRFEICKPEIGCDDSGDERHVGGRRLPVGCRIRPATLRSSLRSDAGSVAGRAAVVTSYRVDRRFR
jgi:hypothetical protein